MVAVERFHADIADEAGEERPVDLLVSGGRGVLADLELRGHLAQLPREVAPFAHAHIGKEMLAAGVVELSVGFLVHEGRIEETPQVDELLEIGLLVTELLVSAVRCFALVLRPVARVLDRESRGGDHHLGEAMEFAGSEQQPADARIHRQSRELLAQGRQCAVLVDGAQLEELPVAVLDLAGRRRLDEGKFGDGPQLERRHAQDHASERSAQDLGRGEFGRPTNSSSAKRRIAMPLAIRPQRPARWFAAACDMGSMRNWSIFWRGE